MPKAKTRKIVLKRFKITGTGKVVKGASCVSHLNRKSDNSLKMRKKKDSFTKGRFSKKIKRMIVK